MSPATSRRFGLGPVFVYEWIASARRLQGYIARSAFLLLLLVGLMCIWSGTSITGGSMLRTMARLGENFFLCVSGTQLALVLLAAPAATAGAICLDRARGTLTHMLMTDLSDAEIVLGKLAVRLVPVLGLLACALPVMELLALLGGVDPIAMLQTFVVSLGVAVLGCSLALVLSLLVGKTHEALLGTYAVWCLWLLSGRMVGVLASTVGWPVAAPPRRADPFFLALAPYWWPNSVTWSDYLSFFCTTCLISILLIATAVLRLRPLCMRESVRLPARPLRGHHGGNLWRLLATNVPWLTPSLERNPVLWREWHRSRPSRWTRAVTMLYVALSLLFTVVAILYSRTFATVFVNGFQVTIGFLLLSVTAATSLAEERARGSLDLLLTTPLSTRQIVMGKWLGAYRWVPLLAILPAATIAYCSYVLESVRWWGFLLMVAYVLCAGAAITSLGLVTAIWFSRLGRAVGTTVTVYVVIAVGWIFAAAFTFGNRWEGAAMASPFIWVVILTVASTEPRTPEYLHAAVFWTIVSGLIGAGLLLYVLADFDRRLGRSEELWTEAGRSLRKITIVAAAYSVWATIVALLSPWPPLFAFELFLGSLTVTGLAASCRLANRPEFGSDQPAFPRRSARDVVRARWAFCVRLAVPVVVVPSLITLCRSLPSLSLQREFFVTIGYMLATCAAAVSVGLASARRFGPGRGSVALAVALWALLNLGWPALASAFASKGVADGLSMGSPFFGATALIVGVARYGNYEFHALAWALFWIGLYAVFAAVLVEAAREGRDRARPHARREGALAKASPEY